MPQRDVLPQYDATSQDQTVLTDLKQEASECRRHGYILTGKFLGQGAYAKVYLGHATQPKINTNMKLRSAMSRDHKDLKVAIKIICADSAPKVYVSKFLPREIAAMNRCYKHENVLQLYDIFATAKRVYLVLEFATAGDLLSHINKTSFKNSPHSGEDCARSMFTEIATGLRFIHQRGIAHRDLKCENVLLTHGSKIKLSDFGFAIDTSDRVDLLRTHCGSYAYASPEILRQQKYDGKMADLWSLGVVLFAMVNGGLPFKESHAKAVLAAMKKPVYFKSHLSTECKELIRGLLRMKPQKRLTIEEVLCHPWVANLHHPDISIVLQIPAPSENISRQSKRPDGDLVPSEVERRIKKQHAHMDDPSNVSKYLCSKMKPVHGVKTKNLSERTQTTATRVDSMHDHDILDFSLSKPINDKQRLQNKIDFASLNTETARIFERPVPKRDLPVTGDCDHLQPKEEVATITKTQHYPSIVEQKNAPESGLEADVSRINWHPMTITIKNLPVPKHKNLDSRCQQRAWVTSRGNGTIGRSPVTRETASPNVINIKIQQRTEVGPHTYDEFQRIKQISKGIKGIPKHGKHYIKRKCGRKLLYKQKIPESEVKKIESVSVQHCGHPSDNTEPILLEPVKFAYLSQRSPNAGKAKQIIARNNSMKSKSSSSATSGNSRKTDKEDSPLEQSDCNTRNLSANNGNSRTDLLPRTSISPTGRKSKTHHYSTTPSQNIASQLPCKNVKMSNASKCASPPDEHTPRPALPPSPGYHYETKFIQIRPFSRNPRGFEEREWNLSELENSTERDKSSPSFSSHNPVDAWQAPSKYNSVEKRTSPQQLLSHRVRTKHLGHPLYPFETKHPLKLERKSGRRVQYGIIRETEPGEGQGDNSNTLHATYDHNAGSRLLYKRVQQAKRTIGVLKQAREQALFPARTKRYVLPNPSYGPTMPKQEHPPKHKITRLIKEKLCNLEKNQTVLKTQGS